MSASSRYLLLGLFLAFLLTACTSVQESTRTTEAPAPVVDTLRTTVTNTRLTSDQDTVVASVMSQSKTTATSSAEPEMTPGMIFTVQIGAFAEPKNALRAQQVAKELFGHYAVFNQYEASLKLYRVSIGQFETRDEAAALLKEVVKVLPKEYSQCWVNTVAK